MLARVILAVQKPALQQKFKAALKHPDIILNLVNRRDLLWEHVTNENADLIIVGRAIVPEPATETIRLFRQLPDSPEVVVISENEDSEETAELIAAGCRAVLSCELPPASLDDVLRTILHDRSDRASKGGIPHDPLAEPRLSDFISDSPTMQMFMRMVRRVVPTDTSLLILGETGVGKERLAMAIHAEGARAAGPFVAVNCGALPETLLESELFGHEEGAFTGATRDRRGMFELAHNGTVFLDEIAEMPLHLQVKLLRVLQEHKIQRLGSEKPIHIDVRVMAASNRDIGAEVGAGQFRKDLYYRLSVVTLTIPPLRERNEDIPALVETYIDYLRPQVGRNVTAVTDDALDALIRYAWPGNVRELINLIERAMLLCESDTITLDDLPQAVGSLAGGQREPDGLGLPGKTELPAEWLRKPIRNGRARVVADFERTYLAAILRETHGRVGETAKHAGIEPRSLYDKMKRYGLRKEDFRRRE